MRKQGMLFEAAEWKLVNKIEEERVMRAGVGHETRELNNTIAARMYSRFLNLMARDWA